MSLLITSIVLVVISALIIVCVYFITNKYKTEDYRRNNIAITEDDKKKGRRILKLIIITPVWFLLLIFGTFTQIEANYVGIVYDPFNGGVQEKTFGEGFHGKTLFESVIAKISTTNKTVQLKTFGQTKDSEYAEFQLSMTYRIETSNAGSFYRITGSSDISKEHLETLTKQSLQKVVSYYDIYSILGSDIELARMQLEEELETFLLDLYKINLISLTIDDVEASDAIETAIQSKSKAKQQLEIAQLELEQSQIDADRKLIQAQNESEVIMIKAKAEADAQEILNAVVVNAIQTMYQAQFAGDTVAKETFEGGGAGAFFTLKETADLVVKQLFYDTWDGKLPQVIADKDTLTIFFPID